MDQRQPVSDPDSPKTPRSEDELAIVSQILFGADVVAMIIDSHPTFIFRR